MRPKKPTPGTILHNDSEGDVAVVVAEGETATDALHHVIWSICGVNVPADHPLIRESANDVRVSEWRHCSKAWLEAEGDDLDYSSYWAPHGDGRTSILVAELDGLDLYALADRIEFAQEHT